MLLGFAVEREREGVEGASPEAMRVMMDWRSSVVRRRNSFVVCSNNHRSVQFLASLLISPKPPSSTHIIPHPPLFIPIQPLPSFLISLNQNHLDVPPFPVILAPLMISKQRKTDSGSPYSTNPKGGEGRLRVRTGPAVCVCVREQESVSTSQQTTNYLSLHQLLLIPHTTNPNPTQPKKKTTHPQNPLQPPILQTPG